MRKWIYILVYTCGTFCFGNTENISSILGKYPLPIYQDVIIHNEVVIKGLNLCDARYRLLRPILNRYQTPFSVLDLGAAQGYFSFRIAHDYPHAHCIMIEENSSDYHHHGDLLYDLCLLNQMDNVTYLRKRMSYSDLRFLSRQEHFDVVLVFLVIHQMAEKLSDQLLFFERILSLGDDVVIEVADDVATDLTHFITNLGKHSDCEFLGEVPRFQDSNMVGKGMLYWFKNSKTTGRQHIHCGTLQTFNGVYSRYAPLD